MLASEFITAVQAAIDTYGDLPIRTCEHNVIVGILAYDKNGLLSTDECVELCVLNVKSSKVSVCN